MLLSLDSCVTFSGFDCMVPLSSQEGGFMGGGPVDVREHWVWNLGRKGAVYPVYPFVLTLWHSEVLVLPGEPPGWEVSVEEAPKNRGTPSPAWP